MRQIARSILCLAFLPAFLSAQETTGSIRGRVVDVGGRGQDGVQVVVSGPRLPRARMGVTDGDGVFLVVGIPNGTYRVLLSRIGLSTVAVQGVEVEVGRTKSIGTVTLEVQPVPLEPLVIEAPRSTVDPVHTTVGANLGPVDFTTLPSGRDYGALLDILPHANASARGDEVNVAGSTGLENQYFIDGVNVTSPWNAGVGTSLPYNFVQAVEVKEGGFQAQYGKALGAVVNVVTRTGTNTFEAEAFGHVSPSFLSATPRPTPGVQALDPLSYDAGAHASGPLIRDRLWYSMAFDALVERSTKEIMGVGPHPQRSDSRRFAGKLTWAASPRAAIGLSVFGDPSEQHVVGPPNQWVVGVPPVNADPYRSLHRSGGVSTVLRGDLAVGPRMLLEGTLAYTSLSNDVEAEEPNARNRPLFWDYVGDSISGGTGSHHLVDQNRAALRLRGTWSPDRHSVVAGVEYEDNGTSGTGGLDVIRKLPGSYFRLTEGGGGEVHNRVPTVYLQDAWRVAERLTVSAGLRWSGQFVSGSSGVTVQRSPNQWQPRLGFAWLLGSSESQRVFGSYGRFYQQAALYTASGFYLDYESTERLYAEDPRTPGVEPFYIDADTTREETYTQLIRDAELDNLDEFTLGYERTFGPGIRLVVRAMRRDLRSSFGFARTENDDFVIGTPGKGSLSFLPSPKREYTALEVSAEGEGRRFHYRTSYVLSRTWGNYPGLFSADQGEGVPGQPLSLFRPWQADNTTGPLPQDRTHVFKLSGSWSAGAGLTLGTLVTMASGSPLNEFAARPPVPARVPVFLVPRGSVGRTPWTWDVNLRAAYERQLPLARSRTRVFLDLVHVGNPQRAVWLDEIHYRGAETDPLGINPGYLQPLAYQPPAAVRVGMEIMR